MAFLAPFAAPALGTLASAGFGIAKNIFSNIGKKAKFDELKDKAIDKVAGAVHDIGDAVISNGNIRQDYSDKLVNFAQRTKAYFTGDKELAKQAAKDGERIQVLSKADWLTEMATQKLEGSDALKDLLKGDVRDFMDDLVKARQELEENGETPTYKNMIKKIDFHKGTAAAKDAIRMLGAQHGDDTDGAANFISPLIDQLTTIAGIDNPIALGIISAVELFATSKWIRNGVMPILNGIGKGVKRLWNRLTGKKKKAEKNPQFNKGVIAVNEEAFNKQRAEDQIIEEMYRKMKARQMDQLPIHEKMAKMGTFTDKTDPQT